MTAIIFAKPRHDYASYRDLYTLIDLSGFPTCFIDEIDPASDHAYIITILNSEIPSEGYPDARARIIVHDLEYRREPYAPLANVERWHMDSAQARMLGARYVPVGSHPALADDPGESQWADDFDVAYIGYFAGVPRRQVIYDQLVQRGVKVSPQGAWGAARAALLRQSKAYLHVHQHADIPAVPALRLVVAAAYKLPFISETCADAGVFGDLLLQFPYNDLSLRVEFLTRIHWNDIKANGEGLHYKLCKTLTFRKSVEAAL